MPEKVFAVIESIFRFALNHRREPDVQTRNGANT